MTTAREVILERIRRSQRPAVASAMAEYQLPSIADVVSAFIAKANTTYAKLYEIYDIEAVPSAVLAVLERAGADRQLHVPKASQLWNLAWHRVPQLILTDTTPSAESAAFSIADYAIAETGTLAFLAGASRPASWHFLPGRELVLLSRTNIFAIFEDMAASIASKGAMPSTLNLVTGPSRTGDIEQTMELGAHGPREVHILLVP